MENKVLTFYQKEKKFSAGVQFFFKVSLVQSPVLTALWMKVQALFHKKKIEKKKKKKMKNVLKIINQ